VADASRLEKLKRRVERDPASPVFAQLAEEYRRAGQHQDAVRVLRAGLRHHPDYHSARVTLGRALLGVGNPDAAAREFLAVLQAAPQNLAACRGLGEIHESAGRVAEALVQFRRALMLAPGDPDLRAHIAELEQRVPADPQVASGQPPYTGTRTDRPAAVWDGRRRLLARLEGWLTVLDGRRA
jgi:Flp pilus assembly protein TadD